MSLVVWKAVHVSRLCAHSGEPGGGPRSSHVCAGREALQVCGGDVFPESSLPSGLAFFFFIPPVFQVQ